MKQINKYGIFVHLHVCLSSAVRTGDILPVCVFAWFCHVLTSSKNRIISKKEYEKNAPRFETYFDRASALNYSTLFMIWDISRTIYPKFVYTNNRLLKGRC